MTEPTDIKNELSDTQTDTGSDVSPESDGLLRIITGLANDSVMEIPVVLVLGGSIVSGVTVSGKNFLDILVNTIFTDEVHQARAKAEYLQAYYKYYDPDFVEDGSPIYCIHLKNVTILQGGGSRVTAPILRVRIDQVMGFTIGE